MASQVHINSNLSLNFKPMFEHLKPRFEIMKKVQIIIQTRV